MLDKDNIFPDLKLHAYSKEDLEYACRRNIKNELDKLKFKTIVLKDNQ